MIAYVNSELQLEAGNKWLAHFESSWIYEKIYFFETLKSASSQTAELTAYIHISLHH